MNNRQAGRRRGRGGQRSQGNPGSGNRIDNRARGNAAQLLEKYKNLARDAQMQGDRVNTEYYLQFADHYFRVLNDSRARQEENRRQRDDGDEDDDNDTNSAQDNRDDRRDREAQDGRRERRNGKANGHADSRGDSDSDEHADQGAKADSVKDDGEEAPAPRRRGRPKKSEAAAEKTESLDAERLPPAIAAEGEEGAAPKPRRTRRKKDSEEASSAA